VDIRNERLTLRVACLATLMAVLWGGNNIAIKFSLNGIPPFALAGIRFLVGSLIVLVWVYLDRVSLKMDFFSLPKSVFSMSGFIIHWPGDPPF